MKLILILSAVQVIVFARPEPPRNSYSQPPLLRQQLPRQGYGPPTPSDSYGSPVASYGPPPTPPKQIEITKNVYVHLPPDEPEDYHPPAVIEAPPPKKHYKLIFIKAPEPPKIKSPIIQPTPQDEHKTLIYVLVKKPEEPAQIDIPEPQPTEPSKPEVFFIKYKKNEEKGPVYGPPKEDYGPPPPSSSY